MGYYMVVGSEVCGRINRYIVGCKYSLSAVRVTTSLRINRYIVGCEYGYPLIGCKEFPN